MIALFISSSFSLFLFMIIGIFVSKIVKFQSGITEKVLVGLVFSNTITSILSLFVPINIYALIGLIFFSFILVFFIKNELKSVFYTLKAKRKIFFFSLPFIVIASIISLGLPKIYDTNLYHIQSIKWIEEFAVVPGLANLHGRFGFNPNIFTFFALTSLFDIFKQEIFSVNFTLFSVFVVFFINKLKTIFEENSFSNVFIYNIIIFISILSLSNYLSSPSPDFISITFPLFILSSLFKKNNFNENEGIENYIPTLILCVYVLTVKLSTLPILLLPIFIFFKFKSQFVKLLKITLLLGLIISPWLIRNIILSGWLVYPFYSIDIFNFDWKVYKSSLILESKSVTGWARNPGEQYIAAANMKLSEWFPNWWHRLLKTEKLLFLLSIIFPTLLLGKDLIKKGKIDFYRNLIVITAFIGVIFWINLAPDFRFGEAFIIIASLSPLMYFNFKLTSILKPFFNTNLLLFVVIFTVFIYFSYNNNAYNVMRIARDNSNRIIKPEKINNNSLFRYIYISGIKVYVPIEGDQCFNHSLPCTPYPDSTLIFRNKTLQSGIKHNENKSTR